MQANRARALVVLLVSCFSALWGFSRPFRRSHWSLDTPLRLCTSIIKTELSGRKRKWRPHSEQPKMSVLLSTCRSGLSRSVVLIFHGHLTSVLYSAVKLCSGLVIRETREETMSRDLNDFSLLNPSGPVQLVLPQIQASFFKAWALNAPQGTWLS